MNVVFRLAQVPAELAAGGPLGPVDAAADHPAAFVFMTILLLMFAVGRVAKETRTSVKWSSFLHLWMVAYLVTLAFLMSVTTAMALVVLIDEKGQPRANFVPPSFLSMAAAVAASSALSSSFASSSSGSAKISWIWEPRYRILWIRRLQPR